MTVSIGRVGMAAPLLSDPTSIQHDPDEKVRFTGITRSTSKAQAIVLRDQLRGLGGNIDEPIVPILFTDSGLATYQGLYQIDSVSSTMEAGDAALWIVRWQMQATRVGSYQAPFVESRIVVATLTNGHGITGTNARGEVGAPGANLTEYSTSPLNTLSTNDIITGADGAVFVATFDPTAYTNQSGVVRYTTTLANWYYGACRIIAAGDYVIGRQCVDSPTSWSMNNGLVRISASATTGYFDVEWYDGAQWDTAKTFVMNELVSAADCNGFHHLTILRNGPEATTIRLGISNGASATATADVTIRWISVTMTDALPTRTWGIKRGTAEAATALTGGIRATSNDASGNRYLLSIPLATTNDLVNGKVNPTATAYRTLAGIGCEVGGTGAAGNFVAQLQLYRFIGQAYEVAKVVGR